MRILLICLEIDGHRQTYAAVIARYFSLQGDNVIIAAADDRDGNPPMKSELLHTASLMQGVLVVSIGEPSCVLQDPEFTDLIANLEATYSPDLVIHVTGDEVRQYTHPNPVINRASTIRAQLLIRPIPYLPHKTLSGNLSTAKRWARWYRQRKRDKKYVLRTSLDHFGIDFILLTNPDSYKWLSSNRTIYLPEIYRAWGFERGLEAAESNAVTALEEFKQKFEIKDRYLYYGMKQYRRGYDSLLKLCVSDKSSGFIYCGSGHCSSDRLFEQETKELESMLLREGRFLELVFPFMQETPVVDLLYGSVKYLLLPYRGHPGMSGTILQAASHGVPSAVPNSGYMYQRVLQYGCGLGYDTDRPGALKMVDEMMKSDCDSFVGGSLRLAASVSESLIHQSLETLRTRTLETLSL